MKTWMCLALLMTWLMSTANPRAQQSAPLITATGCVNRAVTDGSLAGSPGVPPATPNTAPTLANTATPTGAFVLNHAQVAGEVTATSGSTATASPRSFQLDGLTTELEKHVGQQIEVKGTLRTSAAGSDTARTRIEHITVAAVRMVSETCPVQERK